MAILSVVIACLIFGGTNVTAETSQTMRYIAWGYPRQGTLPEPRPIKLAVGTLGDCNAAKERYAASWHVGIYEAGTDWRDTAFHDKWRGCVVKIGDRVTFRDFGVLRSGVVMTAKEAIDDWAIRFHTPTDPDSLHVVTDSGHCYPLDFALQNRT